MNRGGMVEFLFKESRFLNRASGYQYESLMEYMAFGSAQFQYQVISCDFCKFQQPLSASGEYHKLTMSAATLTHQC